MAGMEGTEMNMSRAVEMGPRGMIGQERGTITVTAGGINGRCHASDTMVVILAARHHACRICCL